MITRLRSQAPVAIIGPLSIDRPRLSRAYSCEVGENPGWAPEACSLAAEAAWSQPNNNTERKYLQHR